MGEAAHSAGKIVGLCVRTASGVPPVERSTLDLDAEEGVVDDHGNRERRGVTVISRESWSDTERTLGTEIPWTTRRANVLVEGVNLAKLLVGGTLRLGRCEIEVLGETFPCDLMDELHPGLKNALLPNTRGGVYGRVITPGTIEVGEEAAAADGLR